MLVVVERTYRVVESPIGALTLVWENGPDGGAPDGGALCGLGVHDQRERPDDAASGEPDAGACPRLDDVAAQLEEYFAGRRTTFDVPLATGGTPFQEAVWTALRAVRHGATTSYGELARVIGRPGAAQAVGGANARNPISILVPCHRVVTASGAPSGGGPGIRRKLWLQGMERGERP